MDADQQLAALAEVIPGPAEEGPSTSGTVRSMQPRIGKANDSQAVTQSMSPAGKHDFGSTEKTCSRPMADAENSPPGTGSGCSEKKSEVPPTPMLALRSMTLLLSILEDGAWHTFICMQYLTLSAAWWQGEGAEPLRAPLAQLRVASPP